MPDRQLVNFYASERRRRRSEDRRQSIGWFLTSIALIGLVWLLSEAVR